MIQGVYLDKLLTITVSSKMSLEDEASDAEKYVLDRVKDCSERDDSGFMNHNYLNENEAFFDKIYMKWGEESILVDMNNLTILNNESSFEISAKKSGTGNSFKDLDVMEHYHILEEDSIEITINNISLIVSTINNPQVKTAFRLNNGHLIKNPSGALVNTLFNRDMKLKRLQVQPTTRTS